MRFASLRGTLCVALAAAVASCGVTKDASETQVSMHDGADPANWPSYGRTYGEQHFSPLDQVNTDTVGDLELAWSLDLPTGNTTTQPIAVNGVIYFARAYSVINAVDAVTGELLWEYDPEVPKSVEEEGRPLVVWGSRGIGWWNDKVYTITNNGHLIAVDTKTGKEVWKSRVIDDDDISFYTLAPRVFDGVVIVGNSGDNGRLRGHATAFDAETGEQLWRFWVVPGNPEDGFENPELEMAAETWHGEWWKYGGGGTPWNAFTYDPETQTVFIGTGNSFPYNQRLRSEGRGDNLFLASIVALDVKTGKYKWHYQAVPGEMWDYTMVQDIQVADLEIDGEMRKVLVTAPKNGFFFVIDRITGEFISAEPYVKATWASHYDKETGRPVVNPEALYPKGSVYTGWPTVYGGHSWQAMSFSPQTKLAYIPAVDLGGTFRDNTDESEWDPENGKVTRGVDFTGDTNDPRPEEATAALLAWDPVKQKRAWRVQSKYMVPAGTMATGGGLVFQGSVEGKFRAYSAADGKELWSFDMQAPGVIAPITYSVNGKQYVTILTGTSGIPSSWGKLTSSLKLDYRTMKRRVLTFALDGGAELPPFVAPELKKPDDPDYRPDPALAAAGAKVYAVGCTACHGYDAVAGGRAPDLRYSPVSLDAEIFASIVRDGALLHAGMPKFGKLKDKDLEAMRFYIRAQAHDPSLDEDSKKTGMGRSAL